MNKNVTTQKSDQVVTIMQINYFSFRLETPTIELTREESVSTPDQGYSSSVSFRSGAFSPRLTLAINEIFTTFSDSSQRENKEDDISPALL